MKKKLKKWLKNVPWKAVSLVILAVALICTGIILIWVSTFRIPDLEALRAKALSQSTKIYDRTGKILLYDLNPNLKRTVVPFEEISQHAKDAAIAIEDDSFYSHNGVRPLSFLRSMWVNLWAGYYAQGGSTITQQVIKQSLLTSDKTIPRKIKEWVLAIRLEQIADKDTILGLYLNSIPYGGNLYGIQEASLAFFAKPANNLTIAESAYLAALPQAPTRYSPFGKNKNLLENRKNLVLQKMFENNFITQEELDAAKNEKVEFQSGLNQSIKAPHFVMAVRQYLEDTYGEDMVENGGLKVITTLDYTMQSTAEKITEEYALKNEVNFKASNASVVIIDPKTGNILSMVGSRNYFDDAIDGNFNVAMAANRQPGSTFKPFIYATAFNKGYTPDTVLFDVQTEFSTNCTVDGLPLFEGAVCYHPVNYDDAFRGPMTIRAALAGSINIPAVKTLYLVGISDAIKTAQDMGITSITDANRYGLTLVLGGGSVSLLEMTSAYGVFANNGVRNQYNSIISVQDSFGNMLETTELHPTIVLPEQSALQINDILSDNNARTAAFGSASPLNIPGYDVAVKTGTTNNYVDTWIIGYTPNLVVGAWAGNNDNSPIDKRVAGYVVAPLWRAIMDKILPELPEETFKEPDPLPTDIKPVLRGIWQQTGQDNKIHDILYWVNKNDPRGAQPANPASDGQFNNWEFGVQNWVNQNLLLQASTTELLEELLSTTTERTRRNRN